MEKYIPYILITVLLLLIILVQQVTNRKYINELSELLYKKQDGQAYIDKLNSTLGKLLLRKNKRLFMSVDGYMMLNDNKKIEETFKKLNNARLSYTQKIGLYQKQLHYYIGNKQKELAIETNNKLQELGSKLSHDKHMQIMLDEANTLVEIECNKNSKLAKKMIEKAKNCETDLAKGIYYLRAAKCYHYQNNKNECMKYLKKAELKTTGNPLNKQILSYINDPSLLD